MAKDDLDDSSVVSASSASSAASDGAKSIKDAHAHAKRILNMVATKEKSRRHLSIRDLSGHSVSKHDNDEAFLDLSRTDHSNSSEGSGARSKGFTNGVPNDVMLVGSDGVEVGANRAILASKSKVFQKQLLFSFGMRRDSDNSDYENVRFNFRGKVLKAVIEFVLTDNTKVLDIRTIQQEKMKRQKQQETDSLPPPSARKSMFGFFNRGNNNFSSSKSASSLRSNSNHNSSNQSTFSSMTQAVYTQDQIETLVSLTRAAAFFQLPSLHIQSRDALKEFLQRSPASAFCVLEACRQEPDGVPKDVVGVALSAVRNFVGSIKSNYVEFLSPTVMQEILQDKKLRMDEYQLFQIVQRWASSKLPIPGDQHKENKHTSRQQAAIDLFVPLLRLEYIDPPLLTKNVSSSDLITQEDLLRAFQTQAMTAHLQAGMAFQRPRTTEARWKKSLSNEFISRYDEFKEDVLTDYPPIQSGIHQWTINVDESGGFTWLGISITKYLVADMDEDDTSNPQDVEVEEDAGLQERNWVYSSDGEGFHAGKAVDLKGRVLPPFGTGSQVTFTLYLHWQDHGTLVASVDGCREFVLFTNLRKSLGEGEGFVPTVSMHSPGSVRMVDIRHVRQHPPIMEKLSNALGY